MAKKKSNSKKDIPVNTFYKIENDKINVLKRECPRCGKGVFMAQHIDRFTCGKCGFTEFTKRD